MPGSITLPQIVLDLEEEDRKAYEALQAPKTIVVRYGFMKMIAELPYDGEAKPGCGSKLAVRTRRGIEIAEMLTTTCGNGGCGKSVTRKQMLEYIENSGGADYPFTTQGKVLRIASPEDLSEQARLDAQRTPMIKFAKQAIVELDLPMKLVDVELLLGGERIIFHYASDNWIDFRELVHKLAAEYQTRIEMHQVNARDEARLVADYEKCGQHCCCKQFLKVLKPVSMRSAKVQKATLDPTKISGRCGRLMCCLRYEDETYETLRKKLPHRQSRVITDDGPGTVIDSQILTQLILIKLDNAPAPAAYPLENIQMMDKSDPRFRLPMPTDDRGGPPGPPDRRDRQQQPPPRRPTPGAPLRAEEVEAREGAPMMPVQDVPGVPGGARPPEMAGPIEEAGDEESDGPDDGPEDGPHSGAAGGANVANPSAGYGGLNSGQPGDNRQAPGGQPGQPGEGGRRRRRRRRRRGGGGGGQGPQGSGPAGSGGPGGGPPQG